MARAFITRHANPAESRPCKNSSLPFYSLRYVCTQPRLYCGSCLIILVVSFITASPNTCSLCKNQLDTYSLSRPVNESNCDMFGVNKTEVTPNMRVCSRCRCRSIRRRYLHTGLWFVFLISKLFNDCVSSSDFLNRRCR